MNGRKNYLIQCSFVWIASLSFWLSVSVSDSLSLSTENSLRYNMSLDYDKSYSYSQFYCITIFVFFYHWKNDNFRAVKYVSLPFMFKFDQFKPRLNLIALLKISSVINSTKPFYYILVPNNKYVKFEFFIICLLWDPGVPKTLKYKCIHI